MRRTSRGRRSLFTPGTARGETGAGKRALFSGRHRGEVCDRCGARIPTGDDDKPRTVRTPMRRSRCPSCSPATA